MLGSVTEWKGREGKSVGEGVDSVEGDQGMIVWKEGRGRTV